LTPDASLIVVKGYAATNLQDAKALLDVLDTE
jgi:hypothetical protein